MYVSTISFALFTHFNRQYGPNETVEDQNPLEVNAQRAKEFEETCRRITKINQEYCKVRKLSIHIQLIETVTERLPTMILLVTILFAYRDCERLGHLIGLSLTNYFYVGLVVLTFICGTFGLINPLIHLRFAELCFKKIQICTI